ncbi:MAG: urea ABC transporter substrate-binding protein [Mariprofundales bacterium]
MNTRLSRIFPWLLITGGVAIVLCAPSLLHTTPPPIRVGILHAFTGTMASSERPVAEMTRRALEQINTTGGLLGRRIKIFTADSASTETQSARQAGRLIRQQKVDVIFGCWTSACRKAVKPVVERHHKLLFYPVQYEGFEQSDAIIYTGTTANQQIIPALMWSIKHLGKRIYLVGSDYIFPRMTSLIIHRYANAKGATIVGENFVPLGDDNFTAVAEQIARLKPDVILNSVNGSDNVALIHALRHHGIRSKHTPMLSFSLDAYQLNKITPAEIAGDYVAWSYFPTQNIGGNSDFKHLLDPKSIVTDPMVSAWVAVQLWKQAVEKSHSTNPEQLQSILHNISLHTPEGKESMASDNQHLWKHARIAQINPAGDFNLVWQSPQPIAPMPYPSLISYEEAANMEQRLYQQWHQHWSASDEILPVKPTRETQ